MFGQEVPTKRPTGDSFEDVLYGSESELDESDDEVSNVPGNRAGKRKGDTGARLRIDGDVPMDLLSGAATQITSKCALLAGQSLRSYIPITTR